MFPNLKSHYVTNATVFPTLKSVSEQPVVAVETLYQVLREWKSADAEDEDLTPYLECQSTNNTELMTYRKDQKLEVHLHSLSM